MPDGTVPARAGPAEPVALPAPELTVLDRRELGEHTELRLRVRSKRPVHQLNLYLDRPIATGTITLAGRTPETLPPVRPVTSRWPFELQFYAPPAEGIELTLRTLGPPRLACSDTSLGLDGLPGYRPRPADLDKMPATGDLDTDTVTVTRTLD